VSYSFGHPDVVARLTGYRRRPAASIRANRAQSCTALQILECVARRGPGTTASEISTDLNLSRATTYRLVRLLADDKYLVRMPDLKGFALGRRVAELAAPATATPHLSRAALAVLAVLRNRVRAGVHLVHYSGSSIFITDEDGDIPLTDPSRLVTDPSSTAAGRLPRRGWRLNARVAGHPRTSSRSDASLAARVPRSAGAG